MLPERVLDTGKAGPLIPTSLRNLAVLFFVP